mmetsp:Transcript_2790/g.6484  ORF Transcript_2790/g.6484 Transcript_2790/m.6484 type:complete len:462 (+) Transcript_2790:37-1422(+)
MYRLNSLVRNRGFGLTSAFLRGAGRAFSTAAKPLSFAARYPIAFGLGLTTVKTQSADLLAQFQFEKRETVDWKRFQVFTIFGFFYLGGCQYFLYNKIMPWCFPRAVAFTKLPLAEKMKDMKGLLQLVGQVFLDLGIHIPFVYMPTYYCIKATVLGDPKESVAESLQKGLDKYKKNFFDDWPAALKIWIPADLINFGLMPMHMRLPFMCIVSFGWTCLLSVMRGGGDKKEELHQVARQLPKVDQLLERMRTLHKQYGSDEMNFEEFTEAYRRLGITDATLLKSIFDAMDLSRTGKLDFSEFSSALFLMANDAQGFEQMKFMHEAMDTNQDGYLTPNELLSALSNIIKGRESLLSIFSEEESLDAISAMAMKNLQPQEERDLEAHKEQRLDDFKKKGDIFASCTTLEQCCHLEAEVLMKAIFQQADKEKNSKISIDEFETWYNSSSSEAKSLRNLFSIFSATA